MSMVSRNNATIGIFGGGQLAKLMILCASKYGIDCNLYDPDPDCPAAGVAKKHFCFSFDDYVSVADFASQCDAVTSEFENVSISALDVAQKLTPVYPHPKHFAIAQDRLLEKTMAVQVGLSVATFAEVSSHQQVHDFYQNHGACIIKSRYGGYDGKGQYVIRGDNDMDNHKIIQLLKHPCIVERLIPFTSEISIIAARNSTQTAFLPVVTNYHHHGILRKTVAPCCLPEHIIDLARQYTRQVMDFLNYRGILTIEWFVDNDKLLFNECAPRVHNSGHWSIEGASLSQFDMAIRSLLDLPLPPPQLLYDKIEMLNLLGDDILMNKNYLHFNRTAVYDYGKKLHVVGRKMGHVVIY